MMTRALLKMTLQVQFKENGFPKPAELTIMTWPLSSLWGRSLKEAVSDIFTEVTGIRIRHIENVGLDFPLDFLRALKSNRRPPFDVVYANSIPSLKLAQATFCDPFDEGEFPVLRELGDRARPEAKGVSGWPIVNIYIIRYALMYRHTAFLEGPPESWNVMTDPAHDALSERRRNRFDHSICQHRAWSHHGSTCLQRLNQIAAHLTERRR